MNNKLKIRERQSACHERSSIKSLGCLSYLFDLRHLEDFSRTPRMRKGAYIGAVLIYFMRARKKFFHYVARDFADLSSRALYARLFAKCSATAYKLHLERGQGKCRDVLNIPRARRTLTNVMM
ncbi:hypothetical protein PUN28_009587 [Cardiocondyla obscurior]|uniref:Uncharacterized protein n=1 Tax=Cardiocondyla obscurior TaxID=286306 RepID=A0AAW2FSW8_9HYME